MKKVILRRALAFVCLVTLVACSTSNEVASKRGIQKRKYTKGYFFDFKKNYGNTSSEDQIAQSDSKTERNVIEPIQLTSVDRISIEEVDAKENLTTVESTPITVEPVVKERKQKTQISEDIARSSVEASAISKKDVQSIRKAFKNKKKQFKHQIKEITSHSGSDDEILYYILAILIPFLAVGLVTDWDVGQVILNLILCCLCGLPGIIHALIVVSKNV